MIPPGRERKLRTHAGYEWFYVLSGEMRLMPHWFGPTGDQPVELLSVHAVHGERMYVRAAPRRQSQTA